MKRLPFLFILLITFQAFGQLPPGVIDRLSARSIGSQVQIEVTLSAGYTCNGIIITRSTDSLQFETVGLIGGVCGDSATSVSYSFTDSFPPTNKLLHYQLLLGGRIPTDTRQVVVYDFQLRPLLLAPNPAKDWVEVRFEAPAGSAEPVLLLGLQGQELDRVLAEDGYARISVHSLPAGSYFIKRADDAARVEKLLIAG